MSVLFSYLNVWFYLNTVQRVYSLFWSLLVCRGYWIWPCKKQGFTEAVITDRKCQYLFVLQVLMCRCFLTILIKIPIFHFILCCVCSFLLIYFDWLIITGGLAVFFCSWVLFCYLIYNDLFFVQCIFYWFVCLFTK